MAILHSQGNASLLAQALGRDNKGKISLILYVAGTLIALVAPWIALGIYAVVAAIWLVPDSRIEKAVREMQPEN
jgi:uncharacterized membrane protein